MNLKMKEFKAELETLMRKYDASIEVEATSDSPYHGVEDIDLYVKIDNKEECLMNVSGGLLSFKYDDKIIIDFEFKTDIEPKNIIEWLEEKIDEDVGDSDYFQSCIDDPHRDELVDRYDEEYYPLDFYAKVNDKTYLLSMLLGVEYLHEYSCRCYVGTNSFSIDKIKEII